MPSHGVTAAMREPGFAILESLSSLAVEGCQEALSTDSAMHVRDNRFPGTWCERAHMYEQEVVRGSRRQIVDNANDNNIHDAAEGAQEIWNRLYFSWKS